MTQPLSLSDRRYNTGEAIPFVLVHLACIAAVWTGVSATDLALFATLYVARMFGVTAGYHRYFSHRTFKTGRVFQFVLAVLAQTSAQRGVLWWAANHRHHHRHSDTELDVHSPLRRGFWHAHMGWIFTDRFRDTDTAAVPDLARYPELRWLDRHPYLPALGLGVLVWLGFGWSGFVVGFLWSTVAVWHATFAINSLAHVWGHQRYLTAEGSRNNWWLALLTLGEGWHNNHHHYQSAARQGFRWYEVDFSYYALKALAALRLVHDLKTPPREAIASEARVGRSVVERAARQLAASFHIEDIAAEARAAMTALDGNVTAARREVVDYVEALHLPTMPSMADLRERAAAMFVRTPALNEVVARARQLLIEEVSGRLNPA